MKKIIVFSPALGSYDEMLPIVNKLSVLNKNFQVDYVDSLENVSTVYNDDEYFEKWNLKIESMINNYDIFFGFSLGGVILQKCLKLFSDTNKKLVLFSTPSFCDENLYQKLNEVIELINEKSVECGMEKLNEFVLHPYKSNSSAHFYDRDNTKKRLLLGLKYVRDADSRSFLKKSKINYLHFIGEESGLVNIHNVIKPVCCQLEIVPKAGMRVLQNNQKYCVDKINKFLLR